jgi:sensor histidine kinase YesM
MIPRAWNLSRSSVAIALLVCVALSTQFLFQRPLYDNWPAVDIALAWARGLLDLLIIVSVILLAVTLAGLVPIRHLLLKITWFASAVLTSACLGEWAVLWLQWNTWPTVTFEGLLPRAFRWLPIAAVSGAILIVRQRASDIGAQLHESEVTRLRLEQQRVELQLQILQSQIEPHFLFNTLATIRRLHQTNPARGRATLADFMQYLEAALPEMRASETTLRREVDLITAYLEVLRVRMGARLEVEIDVPAALREHRIPPLSLATLVENAIKHGLSHLPEGGKLSIRAWIERDRLIVRVADTGVGLRASGGTGTGLANLRVRLRGLYGEAGELFLVANEPRGLAATLRIPASRAAPWSDHDSG